MQRLDQELSLELAAIHEQGLHRELRRVDSPQSPHIQVDGREFLNFSSNDYLGLANHPQLKEAAIRAVGQFGAGSGASRLICGSLAPHHVLEEALAAFKRTEAALSFSSGYAAALGTIGALLGRNDVIILDRLVHACIIDAARLSGAKLRIFAHNDLNELERILTRAAAQVGGPNPSSKSHRILVVTESVFSMDGDLAPLRDIVRLKEHHGAWLMLDEAHATGLFGACQRGLAEAEGVADQIDIQMGTLGKALGSSGGYICGSRRLIELLVNRARSFIFSTAPVPAAAAAATASLQVVQSAEGGQRSRALWQRVSQCLQLASPVLPIREPQVCSAIIPLLLGNEKRAVEVADRLRDRGIFAPAIRYPTVARGRARLRLTMTAAHTSEDVARLMSTLAEVMGRPPNEPTVPPPA
jgi:8-amino-7-oxononanoate synthase